MRKSRSGVVFFGVAARITPPGPGLGAEGKLGVATGNTLPRIDLGAGGEAGALQPQHSARNRPRRRRRLRGVATANTAKDRPSAPAASWVPLATLCRDRPRRRGRCVATGNTRQIDLGAGGEGCECATPPLGIDLGAGGELGVPLATLCQDRPSAPAANWGSTGTTPLGIDSGAGGELGFLESPHRTEPQRRRRAALPRNISAGSARIDLGAVDELVIPLESHPPGPDPAPAASRGVATGNICRQGSTPRRRRRVGWCHWHHTRN